MPLYGRKMCSEKFPELYTDIFAKKLCDGLDYDFSKLDRKTIHSYMNSDRLKQGNASVGYYVGKSKNI